MTSLDDELLLDAQENAREAQYIMDELPSELKMKFSNTDILYMMDAIVDYYFTSGVLDAQPDEDGYVDIDLQKVADYVCEKAKQDGYDWDAHDLFLVVQADMDFQEKTLE